MELLFVVLIAFGIGLIARYLLPGRDTYGSMLVPSIGAALSTVVWAALTWAGWKFDGGWIWVVSLVAGGILALILALVIPRSRRNGDAEMLQKLSRA
jgi:quaternary ammonium compound-resistance protein SugE